MKRLIAILALLMPIGTMADDLEKGFMDPPAEAKIRCFWWWLNSNVNEAAITRDLEQMKAKGLGGALIFDAGGPAGPVPGGPVFGSERWRELYRHAIREADRLGLELSLNIQSGWNLGGPGVAAEDSAKCIVWTQMVAKGPAESVAAVPVPRTREGYYKDIAVLAWKKPAGGGVSAEYLAASQQEQRAPTLAFDGSEESYWVSVGKNPGEGPSKQKPIWLTVRFAEPVTVDGLELLGRPGYGPRECELQSSDDGKKFKAVKALVVEDKKRASVKFGAVKATVFRLMITGAYDKGQTQNPRNVQVAEMALMAGGRSVTSGAKKPLRLLSIKTAAAEFGGSTPETAPLLFDDPDVAGEEDVRAEDVIDITDKLGGDGKLNWNVPEGEWVVMRMGTTLSGAHVSTHSPGGGGRVLDYLDEGVLRRYWESAVRPLMKDAAAAGKSMKYLHTDSWELGGANWTPEFRREFKSRRGYDPVAWLPTVAGKIVSSRSMSTRFLCDFRKTIGECIAKNHYRVFSELAHQNNMGIHPESGGPHGAPIDALKLLGMSDVVMMEFWAKARTHRVADEARLFVKQAASAAHTYGRPIVAAEGFTTVGPHWEETLWDNLKPTFDKVACEGLNRVVWHNWACSPAEMGVPGQMYFAGAHLNPQVTWWEDAGAFIGYLNRCQFMLMRGRFVADACYYYGDMVPNFVRLKRSDPAKVLPGYDYDVLDEEILLNQTSVKDGRVVLKSGMSYRVLVLPEHQVISLAAMRKIDALVRDGATVVGPRPLRTAGLEGYPQCDGEVEKLAGGLWGQADGKAVTMSKAGAGRVFWGKTARQVLAEDGVGPDFEPLGAPAEIEFDYIHRQEGETDIYFVSNQSGKAVLFRGAFRVSGKGAELWSADRGRIAKVAGVVEEKGRTILEMSLEAYGSVFVIFRGQVGARIVRVTRDSQPVAAAAMQADAGRGSVELFVLGDGRTILQTAQAGTYELADAQGRSTKLTIPTIPPMDLDGPWRVRFQSGRGGPESATFEALKSFTEHADPGIRYFAGTATYSRQIEITPQMLGSYVRLLLDLGDLREMARVRLNGKDLGVLWKPPYVVDLAAHARAGQNDLEIAVTNFWPNRLIGDQNVAPQQRVAKTNVTKFKKDSPLTPAGLFGPVKLTPAVGVEVKFE